jgi:cytochrome c oxidase subunit II
MRPSRDFARVLVIWVVASAIATPVVAIFLTPDLPPGVGADDAAGQQIDNELLTAVATPVVLLIVIFLVYVLVVFRQKGAAIEEGPRIHGNAAAQTVWIVASTAIVLGLFAFGTFRLLQAGASGGGQGPSPLSPLRTAGGESLLRVQVIGQQWQFTYRYPTFGGLQTPHLVLPLGRPVELHVTSLDVVHSFWAYELGVKADANPGVDNVAYVTPKRAGPFEVRCAELCGIWHGYMFDTGRVVDEHGFEAWIKEQQRIFAPVQRYLPPYSRTYLPDPQRRAG